MSLCFRCEHRARFFETGIRPKSECGDIEKSKMECYMFKPVKPVILKKDKKDKRPQFGSWLFTARSSAVSIAPCNIEFKKYKKGICPYWIPEEGK